MNIEFWGVRGTAPASGKNYSKYGGQTPCAALTVPGGEILIIDAGTGFRIFGEKLERSKRNETLNVHLFLTHFHLDHIIGIPYFRPLFSARTHLIIYSDSPPETTRGLLEGVMAERYFPIGFSETPATKTFKQVPEAGVEIGRVKISSCRLIHPQGSVAYRFQTGELGLVYATDTEHPESGLDETLIRFSRDSDILVYDAMFTPEEYESHRRGWGHSTWLEGIRIARKAGVKKLVLSHYSPGYDDEKLDGIIASSREIFPETFGAVEGEVISPG